MGDFEELCVWTSDDLGCLVVTDVGVMYVLSHFKDVLWSNEAEECVM